VVIEADVELGANVCVDGRRSRDADRAGTKVDNLVQIAHNVQVGEGCLLVAQVGISGSTTIGHHTVFAASPVPPAPAHRRPVVVGAKSAVYKDVPDGEFVTGIPARPHREWLKANAGLQRLDQLRERLGRLERRSGGSRLWKRG